MKDNHRVGEERIETLPLFSVLDQHLLALLRSLTPDEWNAPTLAPLWSVKDVAAHLLDGNLRALSMLRDGYMGSSTPEINSYQDLVAYLNSLNAEWIAATKRLSPAVIIDLLEKTGEEYTAYLHTLDPDTNAVFAVAWAGEKESRNWFHIAREYTEKWHHQQQIRWAVGQEKVLYSKELVEPFLETSLRALPFHYRHVQAPEGTALAFFVTGENKYSWYLIKQEHGWFLTKHTTKPVACSVTMDVSIAWRIFTKGITPREAEKQLTVEVVSTFEPETAREYGLRIVDMLAVMA
ncbi:maleylpyruvate isomerase N-terminal domain-containing protein [Arundinibacter roseus]|uniref:Maleylpyruvate isomerase family mycothiol-dependent enzyme n=1 Tax=Arundinibacter roseus TaxID=2070510 RepID=A0A4R4K263_9BACT|nr:maleylpyruvate isomerase N-terminal domain-containing protein [Arundinibacter roseus]TDB61424.1 maleylpyruvate isomerase family mycothiol-dependent enzyme [Arundinibacter roseus]